MRSVPALDATAMNSLEMLRKKCEEKNVSLILSHVNPQPMKVMIKNGFYKKVGEERFCEHIIDAINLATELNK